VQKLALLFTFLITLALSVVLIIFFDNEKADANELPEELYQVYLAGEKIGVVASKTKLENYIDQKQEEIKNKYNVKTVYPPKDLYIQKYVSYGEKVLSEKEVYDLIKEKSPFTIKGWTFRIKSRTEGEADKIVYVIDKKTFDDASMKTVEAFVPTDYYHLFLEEKQPEIKNTGKIIERVYIPDEQVKYKQGYISTNEHIFTDVNELAKYLLFGTLDEPGKYTVKEGDTIEQISFDHRLGAEEFLVVNPEFKNPNTLLFPGQQVSVGLISPIFDVVLEEHIVEDQAINFDTETQYDSSLAYGVTQVKQEGVDGTQRVVQKRQTTNGAITGLEIDRAASKIIKEPVTKIIVKGTRSNNGTVTISPDGKWVWPTNIPYVITTYYGYRWGQMHPAVDISGCGYGSPIKAARVGIVYKSGYDKTKGNFLILQHDNNYFTNYLHLSKKYVVEGQSVKAGDVIGAMGNSGFVVGTTGTHLHFGVFIGYPYDSSSKSINPMTLYR
jgi:murein DD-endopeptidase MepM/ murein hydrolase activator NlpD